MASSAPEKARPLRVWLREHNRTALVAAAFSLLLAAIGWGLFYFVGYLVILLSSTVSQAVRALDLETVNNASRLRAAYGPAFLALGSCLTALAALLTHWSTAAHWHREMGFWSRAALDAVLFPATMLVDSLDTLRALVWLRASDRPLACGLLSSLAATGGRLSPGSLAPSSADRRRLWRVLRQLHVAQIVTTRSVGDEPQLGWASPEASQRLGPGGG